MADPQPTLTAEAPSPGRTSARAPLPCVVVCWSRDEPGRVGEVGFLPARGEARLGRLGMTPGERVARVELVRQRPGHLEPRGPLAAAHVSREQLVFETDGAACLVRNVGRAGLLVNGMAARDAEIREGDVLEIEGHVVLRVGSRPAVLPSPPEGAAAWPAYPFGVADALGLVGESPAAWDLRHRVAFLAPRPAHALIRGPSGAGKELVAQAIHTMSPRGRLPLVARNAATIPESLVDAELFGNLRNYPNPGMAERRGLIGEADGTTLFLDEFGELPPAAQAHLLRVLDAGEYHRLGEGRARRADLRLLAATNRPVEALKEDVAARLRLRVEVPGLDERQDDVPLLLRHLLARIARGDAGVARAWFPEGDPTRPPRVSPAFVTTLLRHRWRTHARELESLLWAAMARGGDALHLPSAPSPAAEPEVPRVVDPLSLPPEVVQAALDRHGGRQSDAWRDLGLSSRHVLARLVKRHGLRVGPSKFSET